MSWEIDWACSSNTGTRVMGRNTDSHIRSAREWHMVTVGYLREMGVNVPIYRSDSWEVDWRQRDGKMVLARNPGSIHPPAREWHWVRQSTLSYAGVKWKPKSERNGRHTNGSGYIQLTRSGMTDEDIEIAERFDLFRGTRKTHVLEHRLVAAKKFGSISASNVVRHLNGIKTDNRPDNLVLGTTQENTADHNTARLMSMYWHNRFDESRRELEALRLWYQSE